MAAGHHPGYGRGCDDGSGLDFCAHSCLRGQSSRDTGCRAICRSPAGCTCSPASGEVVQGKLDMNHQCKADGCQSTAVKSLNGLQGLQDVTSHTTVAASCKRWDVSQATGFVGLSGAYDIPGLAAHLDARGLHRTLFDRIMAQHALQSLELTSPLHVLDECACRNR